MLPVLLFTVHTHRLYSFWLWTLLCRRLLSGPELTVAIRHY